MSFPPEAPSDDSVPAGAASSPETARLIAFRAAVEVTVAPLRASIPSSPKVKGPVLPINCSVNSASEARLPRPSVSFGVSMVSSLIALSAMVACTVTSPPKPCSVASAETTVAPFTEAGSYFSGWFPLNTPVIASTPTATSTAQTAIRIQVFFTK